MLDVISSVSHIILVQPVLFKFLNTHWASGIKRHSILWIWKRIHSSLSSFVFPWVRVSPSRSPSPCLCGSVSPAPESQRRDRWPDWRDGHTETSHAASGGAVPAGTNAADFLIGRMLSHICAHTRTHRHTPANTLRQACYALAQRCTVYLEMRHKLKRAC